jgi:hypothetical protein
MVEDLILPYGSSGLFKSGSLLAVGAALAKTCASYLSRDVMDNLLKIGNDIKKLAN